MREPSPTAVLSPHSIHSKLGRSNYSRRTAVTDGNSENAPKIPYASAISGGTLLHWDFSHSTYFRSWQDQLNSFQLVLGQYERSPRTLIYSIQPRAKICSLHAFELYVDPMKPKTLLVYLEQTKKKKRSSSSHTRRFTYALHNRKRKTTTIRSSSARTRDFTCIRARSLQKHDNTSRFVRTRRYTRVRFATTEKIHDIIKTTRNRTLLTRVQVLKIK